MKMQRKVRIENVEVGQQFRLHVDSVSALYEKIAEIPSLDGSFKYNAKTVSDDGVFHGRRIGGWVYVEGEETWSVDIRRGGETERYEWTREQISNMFPQLELLLTPDFVRVELTCAKYCVTTIEKI